MAPLREQDRGREKARDDFPFSRENLGSATHVALDGGSELAGHVTERGVQGNKPQPVAEPTEVNRRGAPWGRLPSLKEMCSEAGVGFEHLIEEIGSGIGDAEIARHLGVGEGVIRTLHEHFNRYGLDSVEGQD